METNPIKNDSRTSRRAQRLGKNQACVLCGERDPDALIKVDRSVLERHHPGGRASDQYLTATVCRNCHAILTEGQRKHGVDLSRDATRTMPESLVSVLAGLGAFHNEEGRRLLVWAHNLDALIRDLDGHCPGWRDLPGASKK